MMEMGTEIGTGMGTGMGTGGDIDDDFPIHDDRAQSVFSFKFFLLWDLFFILFHFSYQTTRHSTAQHSINENENENDDGL